LYNVRGQPPAPPPLSQYLSDLCSLDQPNHSFEAYAVSIEETKVTAKSTAPASWERMDLTVSTKKLTRKLRKAPQPPLSHPGATPDSDRAKPPLLADPAVNESELRPGDRVEGLGNFGIPTGELGTVEQTNEEDAVVKWDDDGCKRLHQPWLKKV